MRRLLELVVAWLADDKIVRFPRGSK